MASSRVVVAVAWLTLAAAASAETTGDLDIEGTWHVLVHYKDSQAHNADAERWEDRVWVLVRERDSLRWTEYPIVAFDDKSGRFERSSTNRAARVLQHWEPNEAQLEEIAQGPKVNSRGSRSKQLRLEDGSWRAANAASAANASTITFTANWSIEDPAGLPVFRMEDVLGSAMSERMEGGTLFETDSVEPGGAALRGRYDRDGTRLGTFVARRVVGTRGLGTQEEQEARIAKKLRQSFMDQYLGGEASLGTASLSEELVRMAQEGTLTDEDRRQLRESIRESVEGQVRARGLSTSQARPQITSLTRQIEKLLLEGKDPQEIEQLFREGRLRP
jgi:hypothetical protein